MTTYSAIPTGDLEPDAPIFSTTMIRLRDNPLAQFEGASGAPRLSHLALEALTAGDILHATEGGPVSHNNNVYTKVAEFVVTRAGTIRTAFTLTANDGGFACYGRIYKNGVAFGTERSTTTSATYTQDLAFALGDTCELWLKTTSVSGGSVSATDFNLSAAQYPLTTAVQRQV